ncbi:MAG TPA: DUF6188 family protein [Jiangellaceae bacterium]
MVGDQVGEVDQLRIDFAFTLIISTLLEIRIETAFTVGFDGVDVVYDPENTTSLGPLLDLHNVRVLSASVSKAGTVQIVFEDGRVLRVEPDDHYEACSVQLLSSEGDRRYDFIVLPGGEVATFDVASRTGRS